MALARASREAGSITAEEYVLFASFVIEHIHEGRWIAGHFDNTLGQLTARMDEIERNHGLNEGDYWLRGDAPEEHQSIAIAYERKLDELFIETLEEFGVTDLAELKRASPADYDKMREDARRSVFERENVEGALKHLMSTYESEARKAAVGGAFLAAVVMVGSAAECRLMLKASDNRVQATDAFGRLPLGIKKRQTKNPMTWDFKTLVAVAAEAGWLVMSDDTGKSNQVDQLAELIRLNRNMVHPARYVREKPFVYVGQDMYDDAWASYIFLRQSLR